MKELYFKVMVAKQDVALLNSVKERITQIYIWLMSNLIAEIWQSFG